MGSDLLNCRQDWLAAETLRGWVRQASVVAVSMKAKTSNERERQLRRGGVGVAHYTVERLMRRLGLQGVVAGKPIKTTIND